MGEQRRDEGSSGRPSDVYRLISGESSRRLYDSVVLSVVCRPLDGVVPFLVCDFAWSSKEKDVEE